MKKIKTNRILAMILAIVCIFSVIGCSPKAQSPTEKPSESATESNSNIPLSPGYAIELADDGTYYVIFDDPEYYKKQISDHIPPFFGESLNEIEEKLINNELTTDDKLRLAYDGGEDRRIKVCNFSEMYVPILPDDVICYGVSMGDGGEFCEYYISRTDWNKEDSEYVGYSPWGMRMQFCSAEGFQKVYDYALKSVTSPPMYDYSGSYTLESSTKKVDVFYYGTEEEYNMFMFFLEENVRYIAYVSADQWELPPDEWILSIGCEKYVPQ